MLELSQLLQGLTPAQQEAVTAANGPVVVTAGAGSGKTSVLVRRYCYLLSQGITPEQILTVTFTNKAAEQLGERIAEMLRLKRPTPVETLAKVERSPYLCTLHSFCFRVVNQFGSLQGLENIEEILDPIEFSSAFETHFETWAKSLPADALERLSAELPPRELKDLVREVYSHRHAIQNFAPHQEALGSFIRTHALPFCESLARGFLQRGLYSFDAIEALALKLLRDQAECRDFYAETFKHALVDEFQDTSRTQWEILKLVLNGNWKHLFVVGDPKQSIYRFRQAEVGLFLSLAAGKMTGSGEGQGTLIALDTGFRSAPTLLSRINSLASPLFADGAIPFLEMRAGRLGLGEDECPAETLPYGDEGASRSDLSLSEAAAVAARVRDLLQTDRAAGDIALLFRNSDRIPLFARVLAEASIPTVQTLTGDLFSSYDTLDILNFFRSLARPDDLHSAASLAISPYAQADSEALFRATRDKTGVSLWHSLAEGGNAFAQWFSASGLNAQTPALTALEKLFAAQKHFPESRSALLRILETVTRTGDLSVQQALTKLESAAHHAVLLSAPDSGPQGEAVKLMTVHAAKGLEFPVVFLVDLLRTPPRSYPLLRVDNNGNAVLRDRHSRGNEAETLSHYESLSRTEAEADWEESKRVLYVALTRAEDRLTICLPKDRKLIPKRTWGELLANTMGQRPSEYPNAPSVTAPAGTNVPHEPPNTEVSV